MKETMMMLGFGMGLITGAMLYKYCQGAKKLVDKGEEAVIGKVEEIEKQASNAIKKAEVKMQEKQEKVKNS
ncbi:MAG: hypothetical protein E7379_02610 [Clostridiales bacterium]|nr:hypothetical protein [Clostridiales bacterium]